MRTIAYYSSIEFIDKWVNMNNCLLGSRSVHATHHRNNFVHCVHTLTTILIHATCILR